MTTDTKRVFKFVCGSEKRVIKPDTSNHQALFDAVWTKATEIVKGKPFVIQYKDGEDDVTLDQMTEVFDLLQAQGNEIDPVRLKLVTCEQLPPHSESPPGDVNELPSANTQQFPIVASPNIQINSNSQIAQDNDASSSHLEPAIPESKSHKNCDHQLQAAQDQAFQHHTTPFQSQELTQPQPKDPNAFDTTQDSHNHDNNQSVANTHELQSITQHNVEQGSPGQSNTAPDALGSLELESNQVEQAKQEEPVDTLESTSMQAPRQLENISKSSEASNDGTQGGDDFKHESNQQSNNTQGHSHADDGINPSDNRSQDFSGAPKGFTLKDTDVCRAQELTNDHANDNSDQANNNNNTNDDDDDDDQANNDLANNDLINNNGHANNNDHANDNNNNNNNNNQANDDKDHANDNHHANEQHIHNTGAIDQQGGHHDLLSNDFNVAMEDQKQTQNELDPPSPSYQLQGTTGRNEGAPEREDSDLSQHTQSQQPKSDPKQQEYCFVEHEPTIQPNTSTNEPTIQLQDPDTNQDQHQEHRSQHTQQPQHIFNPDLQLISQADSQAIATGIQTLSNPNSFEFLGVLFTTIGRVAQIPISDTTREALPALSAALTAAVLKGDATYCGYHIVRLYVVAFNNMNLITKISLAPEAHDQVEQFLKNFMVSYDSASGLSELIANLIALTSKYRYPLDLPESFVFELENCRDQQWESPRVEQSIVMTNWDDTGSSRQEIVPSEEQCHMSNDHSSSSVISKNPNSIHTNPADERIDEFKQSRELSDHLADSMSLRQQNNHQSLQTKAHCVDDDADDNQNHIQQQQVHENSQDDANSLQDSKQSHDDGDQNLSDGDTDDPHSSSAQIRMHDDGTSSGGIVPFTPTLTTHSTDTLGRDAAVSVHTVAAGASFRPYTTTAPSYVAPAYGTPSYSTSAYGTPSYSTSAYGTPSYVVSAYGTPSYSTSGNGTAPSYVAPAYGTPSYVAPALPYGGYPPHAISSNYNPALGNSSFGGLGHDKISHQLPTSADAPPVKSKLKSKRRHERPDTDYVSQPVIQSDDVAMSTIQSDEPLPVPRLQVLSFPTLKLFYVPGEVFVVAWRVKNIGSVECSTIYLEVLDDNPFKVKVYKAKSFEVGNGQKLQAGDEVEIRFPLTVPKGLPQTTTTLRTAFRPFEPLDTLELGEDLVVEIQVKQNLEPLSDEQKKLHEMGFTDTNKNEMLLRLHNNQVELVLDDIMLAN